MKYLLALLLAASAWAQITGSPSSLSFYQRQGYNYPLNGTVAPVTQAITLTGSGAWTAVRSGGLMTDCDGSPCFTISASSGSGSGSINVIFSGAIETLAVGSFTGAVTINGSSVVSLTLTVQPHEPYYAFGYKAGYPSGCTGPATGYGTAETCTITNERPLSNAFTLPSPGGTYTDPQFGSTVTRLTPGGQNIQYGALSAWSATGIYALTSDLLGNVDVYNYPAGTEAYGNVSGPNINYSAWDPYSDDRLWYMDGASIKYVTLSTGVPTTAATYTGSITMGGTVDITDDGWWAFHNYADLCAVNLNGLTTGTQSAKTFCISLAAYFPAGDIDFTQITQVDSESGKRYVVVIGLPASLVFSVGTSGLTYEYPLGIATGSQPHSDVGQDEKGRQIFFWNWDDPSAGPKTYLASLQINRGADMSLPAEIGGGLRILTLDYSAASTDGHFGCNWRGVCSFSPYGNSGNITAKLIQSVTAATPCQIGSTGHGYTTGNSVLIGGAAGITSINGVFTVTSTGANTYTLDGHTCSGTYTASSGNSTLNVATAADAPYRQEIWTVSSQINRVAVHRAKLYDNGTSLLGYYATPRCSINRAGDRVACESNMGVPELPSVWVFDTGITSTQRLKVAVSPADTKAVLSYVFPAVFTVAAATIQIGPLPGLTSLTVDVSDGLATQARQYVATGLTAGTQYYYRVCSLGFCDTGQFRTAPTLSSTGRFQISVGGGGTVYYGTTTGVADGTCTAPCDIAPAKGILYTRVGLTGAVTATVVR